MVTPSGWHNDAVYRDAGHDEMQMSVWETLKGQVADMPEDPEGIACVVEVEFPMIRRGAGIVAFADLGLLWMRKDNTIDRAVLYELKPVVKTVFGLLRQAVALRKAFNLAYPGVAVMVEAVVPGNDPKLPDLMKIMTCLTWNRETGVLKRFPCQ